MADAAATAEAADMADAAATAKGADVAEAAAMTEAVEAAVRQRRRHGWAMGVGLLCARGGAAVMCVRVRRAHQRAARPVHQRQRVDSPVGVRERHQPCEALSPTGVRRRRFVIVRLTAVEEQVQRGILICLCKP